ncbi:hypothetical protein [Candidatus Thiodiazotropha sp. LNASS1]|uniref:hypothetical protein n=1 Tax=Candidatus Thiodiazotropha sp. LNASS1 TaxID=3096260 RepID=UPI0034DEBF54
MAWLLFLLLLSAPTQAFHGFQHGAVYAKSLILSESDFPIYVEYGVDGEIAGEIGEATGRYAEARVMAAEIYRAYQVQLEAVRAQFPELELVSKETYEGVQYTTVNGDTIQKPPLGGNTVMVALRPPAQRLLADPSQLILLELPINPQLQLGGATQSLLLDPDGAILWETSLNIGFKTGFVSDPEGNEVKYREHEDTIHGPLGHVVMENGLFARGITDEDGTFSFRYPLPPCPGFFYDLDMPIIVQLYYKRFNPRRGARYPYFMRRLGFDYCVGYGQVPLGADLGAQMAQVAAIGIVASMATPVKRPLDFVVDMTVLAGEARMPNTVSFGGETRYNGESAALERIAQDQYDFDGDGEADRTELGRIITEPDPVTNEPVERFEAQPATADPELQGVWLSSRHDLAGLNPAETLPDLTRLADWSSDFAHRGLLSQINEEDLINTDLYVFRVSDGTLVTERHGLKDSEISSGFIGVNDEKGTFYYTIQIVGAREGRLNIHGYTSRWRSGADGFRQWQAKGQMNPAFYQREADHLRPGEPVQLIAINRATGYMGSLITAVKQAGSGNNPHEISFPIRDLMMGPPNLKVWAERTSKVEQGLTRGEQPEQAIGHEGAGLADDTEITVYTEWFDRNGRALPEGLDEHGYTGRLAKVIAPNRLAAAGGASESGNSLSQFEIKTGRQTQVIRLPERILGKQHLYVQVSGEPMSGNPEFGASGLHQGKLQYRPDRYVPVRVPVFDEDSTLLQRQAYREAKQAFDEGTISIEPEKPEPIYRYVYRPEFQFSVYDLAMREIRQTDLENEVENLLPLDKPVIASTDAIIDLLYSLTAPESGPLNAYSYDNDRELVFALGEQEIRATLGDDQQLRFDSDSLEHLALLDLTPEDYLTLRLYSNNDAGNVLWEWAFGLVPGIVPTSADISADLSEQILTLYLPGFNALSNVDGNTYNTTIRWSIEGPPDAQLEIAVTESDQGLHANRLVTSHRAGDEFWVTAEIIGTDHPKFESGEEFRAGPYTVYPGEPAQILLTSTEDELPVDNAAIATIQAEVADQHDNHVIDGTPIEWNVAERGHLEHAEWNVEGGQAELVARSGDEIGELEIIARSGEVTENIILQQIGFDMVFSGSVASAEVDGAPMPLTVSAMDATDGAAVNWIATHGKVIGGETLAAGQAQAMFYPGPRGGDGTVFASIGQQFTRTHIPVNYPPGPPVIEVIEPLLIGDRTVAGSEALERLDGRTRIFNYKTETELSVSGLIPGDEYIMELGSARAPNLEPVAWYFMDQIDGTQAPDIYHDHNGQVTGDVVVDTAQVSRGTGSYHFTNGVLNIPANSALNFTEQFSLHLAVRPQILGAVPIELVNKAGHYGIRLLPDTTGYRAEFWVMTGQGEEAIQSPALISPDHWSTVSVSVKPGLLQLNVSGQNTEASLTGSVLTSVAGISIGEGFSGWLDDLKIFDLSRGMLGAFPNGGSSVTLVADANGEISTIVQSLGNLRTHSPLEWITEARLYWRNAADQIEDLNSTGGFIQYMAYSSAAELNNVLAQVLWDEGEDSAAKTVSEFAASMLLLGDVRDIAKYGGKWYFGLADDGEKLTTTLAGIGIVTTIFPVVDAGITALKIIVRMVADAPGPVRRFFTEFGHKIVDEIGSLNFTTVDRFSGALVHIAGSTQFRSFLQRNLIKNLDDLEAFAKFQERYGDRTDALIQRFYTGLDSVADDVLAATTKEGKVRNLVKLAEGVSEQIGRNLSEEALDGMVALMKIRGINKGRIDYLVNHVGDDIDAVTQAAHGDILEGVLTTIKQIDELPNRPDNYTTFYKQVANTDPRMSKGGIHAARDIDAGGINLSDVAAFEQRRDVLELPPTPTGRNQHRRVDVALNDNSLIEYKDAQQILSSSHEKLEFIKDILLYNSSGRLPNWVIRGTDQKVQQVRNKMLKMLGEDGGTLDDVLEEAIESMDSEAARNAAYNNIENVISALRGSGIVRTQSY